LFLVLSSTFVLVLLQPWALTSSQSPPVVFELELPDFHLPPSSAREITIPSSSVNQVLVHVLKPAADNINYDAIKTSINGQASAIVAEVVNGLRGKIVKLNLKLRPGYEFVNGSNTVEVWAQTWRGRSYYASFVIKTATGNWNPDFTYHVVQATGASDLPPEVILLDPQGPIQLRQGLSNSLVKISGRATSGSKIVRISVDGRNIQTKLGSAISMRQLTRPDNVTRDVSFETTTRVTQNTPEVVVEAEDESGSRTQVLVPVLKPGSNPSTPIRKKFALIIGISRYKNTSRGIPNLDFADLDARSLYQLLQRPETGGFARENMMLLDNENATLARIREALTNFISRASEDDLLLIFFAGHGAPDPRAPQNLYLAAYDTDVSSMPETALLMSDLRSYVDHNVKSKRLILLLDACHSGGVSNEGTRDVANNLANLYLEKLLYQEEGRAIMSSSDINEPSRESRQWGNGHGVFTYYLLDGLKGSADSNHDRLVSVGELFRYVRQKVRLATNQQQNPRLLVGNNEQLTLAIAPLR
jgi:hypothetical protein